MDIKHSKRDSGGMFYIGDAGDPEAKITYRNTGEKQINILQTYVDPSKRGKTVGKQLVHAAAEMAKREGLRVSSSCWFASELIMQSDTYSELME